MATKVPIPRLGQSEETVTIQSWKVKEGDTIKKGDVLFDVETDKAVLDVESQFEGTVLKILVPAGKEVPVLCTGLIIGSPGEDISALLKESAVPAAAPKAAATAPAAVQKAAPAPTAPAAESAPVSAPVSAPKAAPAAPAQKAVSPRARAFAKDYLIDINKVPGTGGGVGRVTEKDVQAYLDNSGYNAKKITPVALNVAKEAKLELLSLTGTGDGGRITLADVKNAVFEQPKPMSTMRKVIARRLTESKHMMPHFYVTVSIDMTAVKAKRAALKKQNISISVNVFVTKAVALALREFPTVNAECTGDAIKQKSRVNLGIAVSLDNGLIVPVIRNADKKALDELQDEIAEQAAKARAGKLTPEEISGGTFTISNMGMMNVENFAAIINPGEAGILAVSSAILTPVAAKDGSIVAREMMKVTLSVDHRIVDGSEGAKFVNAVKSKLEDAALWDSLI
ncbi:MAG: Dihydrolipoyllysine-residue acetyltransferase component of pyruvate dehydrogenase complex [Lentisphaerae bacterium ADurb.Bin242]|nr:MAG: Dihydrolipoyllysine-residue acetyltransferase component of pyruvate dehydrogenase complex [Lentisphaerae bacterium ADurb.Bin242]